MAGLLREITDLPTANTTTVNDYLHIKQGTTDRKITWSDLIKGHATRLDNPHNVTAAQLNLENVTNSAQLKIASNLSDLSDLELARGNLEVYSIAEINLQHNSHADNTNNPHNTTKAQVGLGNLTNDTQLKLSANLSDVLSVEQARFNLDVYSKSEVAGSVNGHASLLTNPHGVTKTQVGLGNVSNNAQLAINANLSDIQNAVSARINLGVFSQTETTDLHNSHADDTNNPHNTTKAQVGLSNLNNYGTATSPTDGSTSKYVRADALNNLYEQVINAIIPIGGIILWNGNIGSIPANFKLCDGENGTPDLRARFPIGAGSIYDPDDTGGSSSVSHTHTVAGHTLTVPEIPNHGHPFIYADRGTGSPSATGIITGDDTASSVYPAYDGVPAASKGKSIGGEGGDGSHAHGLSTTSVDNLPPYYALAYIMRVA